ncbi:MAG TPA: hypothetical protein VD905_03400 [Flavobacteriales bacterium]|nr:hypothetical protein [Flavobacteriales bacterium]
MRIVLLGIIFSLSLQGSAKDPSFRWTVSTNPYHNYITPDRSGLKYYIKHTYHTESRELRRYLKQNYDIKASQASLGKILRDIATGNYFDRHFHMRIKSLHTTDTLFVKIWYENGDSVVETHTGVKGLRLNIPLTRYKNQHDFTLGTTKSPSQKGLVTCVDVFVKSINVQRNPVTVLTKIVTEADLPGTVTKVRGRSLLKK